jgi:hypothetical protein
MRIGVDLSETGAELLETGVDLSEIGTPARGSLSLGREPGILGIPAISAVVKGC